MLEQKQLIDLHTNIATNLLENIKERKLDVLFETEEKLLNGQGVFFFKYIGQVTNKEFYKGVMRM